MEEINYAIVGFGGIAKTHALGSYTANIKFKLPFYINLKTIVTRKPLEIKVPGSRNIINLKEVLEDHTIDFLDICTPNDNHKDIVREAVKYKKAIYCEKPLAENYEEALAMTKLVKESNVRNAVALMYRFMPAIRLIKEAIEEKVIGDIIDFKIKLYHKSYLDENKKATWRTGSNSGGGALLDLGVHLIDVIHFTLGYVEEIKAKTRIFFRERTNVDEVTSCELKLENGILGNLEVSRIFADLEEPTIFTIYGSKGSIKMSSKHPYTVEIYDYDSNSTIIKSAKGREYILENYPAERDSLGFHQDCHMASIINFSKEIYLNENNSITPTFEDALKAQRVVEAAYVSNRENRSVNINHIK